MVLTIVTIFFLLLYAWLIAFYRWHWNQTPTFEPAPSLKKSFLSIVIAARNEKENIPPLLLSLQQQDYPVDLFEIIVVDDFSTDNTTEKVRDHAPGNLVLLHAPGEAQNSSKKLAISYGVQQAKGELIITTDADCLFHPQWLSTLNAFYQAHKVAFIAAPVKYNYRNNLLHIFQTLDFMVLQGITAASVTARFHNMCNGANLAYTKKAFRAVNGFAGIDSVATGDDMLLMQKIAEKYPGGTGYLKSKTAIVQTSPMHGWKQFIMQRRRWASKTPVYKDWRIKAVLLFVYFFNLLFIVLLATALLKSAFWWQAVFFLLIKTIIEWPFVGSIARFYEEQKLMKWFLPFQPLHIIYTVGIGVLSQMGKYEWKGRRTK
jgi:cellulose synthase/poly-beta-1,6-N-acetylglucosamine synthase-like glycosyltransferase